MAVTQEITTNELHHAVMEEYCVRYIHDNHFADDPFVVVTPRGPLVVQQFYADEQHGGMYETT